LHKIVKKDNTNIIVIGDTSNYLIINTNTLQIKTFNGHHGLIKNIYCVNDFIFTLGEDKIIKLWDIHTFRLLESL